MPKQPSSRGATSTSSCIAHSEPELSSENISPSYGNITGEIRDSLMRWSSRENTILEKNAPGDRVYSGKHHCEAVTAERILKQARELRVSVRNVGQTRAGVQSHYHLYLQSRRHITAAAGPRLWLAPMLNVQICLPSSKPLRLQSRWRHMHLGSDSWTALVASLLASPWKARYNKTTRCNLYTNTQCGALHLAILEGGTSPMTALSTCVASTAAA